MKNIFLYLSLCIFTFQSCLRDNEDPVPIAPFEGAVISPEIGGPAVPNQVWLNLSTGEQTINKRPSWDLAFHSGKEFKVTLNFSIQMAAGVIEGATDINAVTSASVKDLQKKIKVGTFKAENENYVDNVEGNYASGRTAIAEISADDAQNAIYLVNLGKEIYTEDITLGQAITGGADRGWKKIQITRNGNGYKLKYADLDATTYKEVIINKNPAYHFTFFNMKEDKEVSVQPEKNKWDLCFTVFVNVIAGSGTYTYSDFVIHNTMGGVGAYMVEVPSSQNAADVYKSFSTTDVDNSKFVYNDHRAIGSNWRDVLNRIVYNNVFFIIKDSNGVIYKLKFNRLTNINGERGYPEFEYKPL